MDRSSTVPIHSLKILGIESESVPAPRPRNASTAASEAPSSLEMVKPEPTGVTSPIELMVAPAEPAASTSASAISFFILFPLNRFFSQFHSARATVERSKAKDGPTF